MAIRAPDGANKNHDDGDGGGPRPRPDDDSNNHDNVDCDGDGGAHARPAQPPAIQAALLSYSTTTPSTCQLPNSQIIPSRIVMRRILVLLFCKSFSFPIYWNIDIMYVSVMNFLNLL